MQMENILGEIGGIQSIARELNIDEATARAGASALLPQVMGGFKNQAQADPRGVGGMADMLGQMGGGGLLDSVLRDEPSDVAAGNQVVNRIFGSNDVEHAVTANAASKSGLPAGLLQKMLPLIAMAVAGYIAKQAGGAGGAGGGLGGGLGGILGSVLGGAMGTGQAAPAPSRPADGGQGGGFGGLGSLLDMDGDGNPLNDLMGMARKFGQR